MNKNLKKPETLKLDDGRVLELKSLKVARLRRFMLRFNDINELDGPDSVKIMDILSDCAATALAIQLPEETEFLKKEVEDRTPEDREPFGELLDMDEVHRVNRVMGGVAFDDPNLPEEALAESPLTEKEQSEEDGENLTSTV